MDQNLIVSENISIQASPEKVWDCLINPRKIKRYLYGTETITTWKEGEPIIFTGTYEGKEYTDKGRIVVNRPLEMLEYTYWSGFSGLADVPENYSLVTYTIEDKSNAVLLTIVQTGFVSEQGKNHASASWKEVLKQITEIAEKEP